MKRKGESGNYFALIPLIKRYDGQLELLRNSDMYEVNSVMNKTLISDIRGKTEKLSIANYKNPVHAISNKKIAQVLPEIMYSPIAYNEKTGYFEFTADLDISSKLGFIFPELDSEVPLVLKYQGESINYSGVTEIADMRYSVLNRSNNYLTKSSSPKAKTLGSKTKSSSDGSGIRSIKECSANGSRSNLQLLKKTQNGYQSFSSGEESNSQPSSLLKRVQVHLFNQGFKQDAEIGEIYHNINLSEMSDKSSNSSTSCMSRESTTSSTDNKSPITKTLSHFNQKIPKIQVIRVPRISLMLQRKYSQEFKSQKLFSMHTSLSTLCEGIARSSKSMFDLPREKLDFPNVKKYFQKIQAQKGKSLEY